MSTENRPTTDYSKLHEVDFVDEINALLDRAQTFNGLVEDHFLDKEKWSAQVGHETMAHLSWQIRVNIESAMELNNALWERIKQLPKNNQTQG